MNNIQEHKDYVTSQLEKAFGAEIEKAHNVGDEKEINGRTFVWTEYAPGKFDWHLKKEGEETDETKQPKSKQNKTDETTIGGKSLSEHAAAASTEALKKVAESPNAGADLKAAAQKELENRGENSGESTNKEGKIKPNGGKKSEYDDLYDENGELNQNHPVVKQYNVLHDILNHDWNKETYNEWREVSKKLAKLKEKRVENLVNELLDEDGNLKEEHPIVKNYRNFTNKSDEAERNGDENGSLKFSVKAGHIYWSTIQPVQKKYQEIKEKKEKEKRKEEAARKRSEVKDKNELKMKFDDDKDYYRIESFGLERGDREKGLGHVFEVHTFNKKDIKEDIDILNDKLGTEIKPDEFVRRGSASEGHVYRLYYNSETGEVSSNIQPSWKKKTDNGPGKFTQAVDIINDYEDGLSSDGFRKGLKKEFKEHCEEYGMLNVAKELCQQDNWDNSNVHPFDKPTNEDELKAAATEIFERMGVKLDDETNKFLKYDEDKVRWI